MPHLAQLNIQPKPVVGMDALRSALNSMVWFAFNVHDDPKTRWLYIGNVLYGVYSDLSSAVPLSKGNEEELLDELQFVRDANNVNDQKETMRCIGAYLDVFENAAIGE